jgi:MFS family permease
MAEYVRRKRPPASHPYWARLYDRAHPPPVVLPVAIPASAGLVVGLSAGLHDSFSSGDAARVALEVAGGSAGALFVVGVLVLRLDASRQTRQRERWAGALVSGLGASVAMFAAVFMATFLALLWYATCSGQGPWFGMLIGAGLGGGPAALISLDARRRWRERQHGWPRWKRMRGPRETAVLTVTQVPAPPLSASASQALWTRLGNGQ